jgi:hypothetical protein
MNSFPRNKRLDLPIGPAVARLKTQRQPWHKPARFGGSLPKWTDASVPDRRAAQPSCSRGGPSVANSLDSYDGGELARGHRPDGCDSGSFSSNHNDWFRRNVSSVAATGGGPEPVTADNGEIVESILLGARWLTNRSEDVDIEIATT